MNRSTARSRPRVRYPKISAIGSWTARRVPDRPHGLLADHPFVAELDQVLALVLDPRRPHGGVDVAKPALPLLDVGLQDADRLPVLYVAVPHLVPLLLDEAERDAEPPR